jgi:hypothetical protein
MPNFSMEIPFKGQRDYLHSSDTYNALINGIQEFVSIDTIVSPRLIFKDFAHRPLDVIFDTTNANPKAIFTFNIDGSKNKCELIERDDAIKERIPFNEKEIIEKCMLDVSKQSIDFQSTPDLNYTLIEIVVAANKCLHTNYFKNHPGKWLFTEIITDKPLISTPFENLSLKLKTCLGTRLTKCSIILDGAECGYIFFSLKPN